MHVDNDRHEDICVMLATQNTAVHSSTPMQWRPSKMGRIDLETRTKLSFQSTVTSGNIGCLREWKENKPTKECRGNPSNLFGLPSDGHFLRACDWHACPKYRVSFSKDLTNYHTYYTEKYDQSKLLYDQSAQNHTVESIKEEDVASDKSVIRDLDGTKEGQEAINPISRSGYTKTHPSVSDDAIPTNIQLNDPSSSTLPKSRKLFCWPARAFRIILRSTFNHGGDKCEDR
eukprot:CFRG3284T1